MLKRVYFILSCVSYVYFARVLIFLFIRTYLLIIIILIYILLSRWNRFYCECVYYYNFYLFHKYYIYFKNIHLEMYMALIVTIHLGPENSFLKKNGLKFVSAKYKIYIYSYIRRKLFLK
jgi:hypothetical protein